MNKGAVSEGKQGEYMITKSRCKSLFWRVWKDTYPAGNNKMSEEKLEILAQELTKEVERVNKLCRIVDVIYKLVGEYIEMCGEVLVKNNEIKWNEGRFFNMRNELTHLHNEIHDVQKLLGIDGSEPKLKPTKKYEHYSNE